MARLPLKLNTRTFTSHLVRSSNLSFPDTLQHYGPYMYLPLIATLVWLGGLLALVGLWAAAGKPRYMGDEASVVSATVKLEFGPDRLQVFISDVGAAHKTLFICICCITSAFYISSLFAERWLRHVDRLPTDLRRREKVFGMSKGTCKKRVDKRRLACHLLLHCWIRRTHSSIHCEFNDYWRHRQ